MLEILNKERLIEDFLYNKINSLTGTDTFNVSQL